MQRKPVPAPLGAAVLILLASLLAPPLSAEPQAMERSELVIETAAASHRFSVELANTPAERATGLMFRERLPADAGMLFLYDREQMLGMWMKNTLIPLDMLFIAGDGRILRIAERTVPQSTAVIGSGRPVRAVLELNGGTADRLGIEAGDRVRHPFFSPD